MTTRRILASMCPLLVVLGGCDPPDDSGERVAEGQSALDAVSGSCNAVGSGTFDVDSSFAFDIASATTMATFSYSAGLEVLADVLIDQASCVNGPDGVAVRIGGTATWSGVPGRSFVFTASLPDGVSPAPGASLDSVGLEISGTGGTVHGSGGFLTSGTITSEPGVGSGLKCTATAPNVVLSPQERIAITFGNDPIIGTVTYRRTDGGGLPFEFDGVINAISCRLDGADYGDARGFGSVNGVGGYTFGISLEDRKSTQMDSVDLRIYDAMETQVLRIDVPQPPDGVSVIFAP